MSMIKNRVEAALATKCVFMQGASGDMSPNPNRGSWEPRSFGETVADHVIAVTRSARTETPAHPSVKGTMDTFQFPHKSLVGLALGRSCRVAAAS